MREPLATWWGRGAGPAGRDPWQAASLVLACCRRPTRGGRRDRRRGELGQTTTEWLMIAGLLTAVAVVLLGIIPPGLRFYAQSLITSVRTIAP